MNDTAVLFSPNDSHDPIVERIHETRHRMAAYFNNDFMRMARFGADEEDLPADFLRKQQPDKKDKETPKGGFRAFVLTSSLSHLPSFSPPPPFRAAFLFPRPGSADGSPATLTTDHSRRQNNSPQ